MKLNARWYLEQALPVPLTHLLRLSINREVQVTGYNGVIEGRLFHKTSLTFCAHCLVTYFAPLDLKCTEPQYEVSVTSGGCGYTKLDKRTLQEVSCVMVILKPCIEQTGVGDCINYYLSIILSEYITK